MLLFTPTASEGKLPSRVLSHLLFSADMWPGEKTMASVLERSGLTFWLYSPLTGEPLACSGASCPDPLRRPNGVTFQRASFCEAQ